MTIDVVRERLANQFLTGPRLSGPVEVVRRQGAVPAQDYTGAKWAVGMRTTHSTHADVEQAVATGHILRTHVLRPTWHFVTPEDIRWLLAVSSPRIHAVNAYYYRQLGLDAKTFARSCAMTQRILEGGVTMTRAEIGTHLKRAKVPADGLKLAYLMMQ